MAAAAAAPAVDDEPALLESADADPGPRAAVGKRGKRRQRDRNAEQRAERRADRERELRAGPETHVLRNRTPYLDGAARDGIVLIDETAEVVERSGCARAVRREAVGTAQLDHGREPVERETDAAEAAAEAAAHVHETEMQPSRRPDSHRQPVDVHAVR